LNLKTTYSEEELVDSLRGQDQQAFTYLYDNYSGALYGIIHSILTDRETANDTLQEVFVNIWRKIDFYDAEKGRLFTWMLNIARNAAIDKIRSKEYRNSLKNQPFPENVNTHDEIAIAAPKIDDTGLKKILTRLKPEQRELIDLSYFQGWTHEEIAKILSIPLGTVKTRIRTALTLLRTMMQ
jgi:RNA polymerase sigma-70 factor (ECF subfamily)